MDKRVEKFWKEYIELDYLERRKKIENQTLFKTLPKLLDKKNYKIKDYNKVLTQILITTFKSYIDDLIEYKIKKGD